MVLDITNNKRVDSELLQRITGEVEKRLLSCNMPPLVTDNMPKTDQLCIDDAGAEYEKEVRGASIAGRPRETEQLLFFTWKSFTTGITQFYQDSISLDPFLLLLYIMKWLMNKSHSTHHPAEECKQCCLLCKLIKTNILCSATDS